MEGYRLETYGNRIASIYDDLYPPAASDEAAAFLAELAHEGRVLELAIGTGRVALALAARGISVEGIDISEAMVERLRAKPGGQDIPVTIGDFADVRVAGEFSLIYVVFNTFFALTTQQRQLDCFANVAEHLAPGGSFLIEAFVPDLSRFRSDSHLSTTRVEADTVRLDASRHDPVNQRVDSSHVHINSSGVQLYPVSLRYAWPSELDLMARLAGLQLRERWDGWGRQPYTASSRSTVNVYMK